MIADLFYTIFIIWNYLWILGILCLLLRSDYKETIIEIFSMIIQKKYFFNTYFGINDLCIHTLNYSL